MHTRAIVVSALLFSLATAAFGATRTWSGTTVQTGGNITYSGANTYAGSYSHLNGTTTIGGGTLPANFMQANGNVIISNNATPIRTAASMSRCRSAARARRRCGSRSCTA